MTDVSSFKYMCRMRKVGLVRSADSARGAPAALLVAGWFPRKSISMTAEAFSFSLSGPFSLTPKRELRWEKVSRGWRPA